MRVVKRMLLMSLALGCAGCAGFVVAPPVTPAMAARSGRSGAFLEAGRHLYGGRCGGCHALSPPSRFGPDRWREIVDEMSGRAKIVGSEQEALLAYLLAARDLPQTR